MRIIVDGDGCPGISYIEKVAKEENIDLLVYSTIDHNINLNYGEVKRVDAGFQSVDMYVINDTKEGDIVISQDFGVAALALGKKAYAISPKGMIFSNDNIERLLFERHLSQKARKAGLRGKNASKRKKEDDINLYNTIKKVINQEK
ncbi:YaiI/YqxD family protein [Clostridium mediterraneense]|uniref:YaiI/YqxD family protein n=1 Tax=Clostridium mediterraneense TaxID=1805472 RepID=UPI0008377CCA|nr:YaiI/YqxD family protein [Clostridium mediterraneense]